MYCGFLAVLSFRPTAMKVALLLIYFLAFAFAAKVGHGIGVGLSSFTDAIAGGPISTKESMIFNYTVPVDSDYGMITHWWTTGTQFG